MSANPIRWAIVLTLLVNAAAMISPIINGGDAVTYASIAQHMAVSGDWSRLIWDGKDWLDKPHFPFWITALVFKLLGISAWSYILPGFLFHILGGYFLYRLARLFFDKDSALLSVLLYVSILNLMDSSIEIKAEAYLTTQILAASYYWLRYDAHSRTKHLLLGALFTALAVMTKGIFTLITIAGGLICLWIYQREWRKPFTPKWLLALLLSLILTMPELYALYVQFGRDTGGSPFDAFRFFFWDSQFGRFFNTGPIQNHNGNPLYYVLVFLWAFFPWTPVFFVALFNQIKTWSTTVSIHRTALIFLGGMFIPTFLMFSATKFQMGYYIDILLPYAALFCAHYLRQNGIGKRLFLAQTVLCILLITLVVGMAIYVANSVLAIATGTVILLWIYAFYSMRRQSYLQRALITSVISINLVFGFLMLLTAIAFTNHSIPYNVAQLLSKQPAAPVYVFHMPEAARELCLYQPAPCSGTVNLNEIQEQGIKSAWVVIRSEEANLLGLDPQHFKLVASMPLIVHKTGTFNKLLRLAKGDWPLETIELLHYTSH